MIDRPRTFLLDENIPRKVLSTLRRAGYVAVRVYDEKLYSQPDVAIFTYARARHMTTITFDTDYLNQIAFPPPHAGIVVLRFFPRNASVHDIASATIDDINLPQQGAQDGKPDREGMRRRKRAKARLCFFSQHVNPCE